MKHVIMTDVEKFEIRNENPEYHSHFTELWNAFKVEAVGICRTDKFLSKNPAKKNVILGHEVLCSEEIEGKKQYYVVNNEISCGECEFCMNGNTSHCQSMLELGVTEHGGYAEYIRVPRQYLIPTDLEPLILNTLVEPLSCALHGFDRVVFLREMIKASPAKILVIGSGVAGKMLIHLLINSELKDAKLFVYDVSPSALQWCMDDHRIVTVAQIKEETMDIAIDCTGTAQGVQWAENAIRKGGVLLIYGVPDESISIPFTALRLFQSELTITTSMSGCRREGNSTPIMERAIQYIKNHKEFFATLIGHRIKLDDLPGEIINFSPMPGTRTVVEIGIDS
jgi:L-iditol 2-dehydrogenase